MKVALVILSVTLLAGCGMERPQRIAVLQNPETRQTVECRVDPWGSLNYKGQVDECVATYQKAGFRLLVDSAGS